MVAIIENALLLAFFFRCMPGSTKIKCYVYMFRFELAIFDFLNILNAARGIF